MNTQNEDSGIPQLPKETAMEMPASGAVALPPQDTAGSIEQASKSEGIEKSVVDDLSKELAKSRKSGGKSSRKGHSEPEPVARGATALAAKPIRAVRVKAQPVEEEKPQAQLADKPTRTANRRLAKKADDPALAASLIAEIPPITPAAIEFLGAKNQTVADVIKLDPDSLAFVRYHLNRMRQLEAGGVPAEAPQSDASTPISPALKRVSDMLAKGRGHEGGLAAPVTPAKVSGPAKEQSAAVAITSYSQEGTRAPAYASAIVQLRTLDLPFGVSSGDVLAGETTVNDHKRMHKDLRNAQIPMSAPINNLTLNVAADLAASEIEDVRAIKNVSAQRFALDAMSEIGLFQPYHQSELRKQAPDLVEPASRAHKATTADAALAFEVSIGLGTLVDSAMPPTEGEVNAIAMNAVKGLRAIESPAFRDELLVVSHQIGLWHSVYAEEFRRQAPDLSAEAATAYAKDEFKKNSAGITLQSLENSIERDPIQPVRATQQVDDISPLQSGAAADAARRLGLGWRLLLATRAAANWMNTSLQARRTKGQLHAVNTQTSRDMPAARDTPTDDKSAIMPEAVARRFLKVEQEYYFQNRTLAFSDQGHKLATRGTNPEVVRSLIEVAKARGWDSVTLKGTEEFRRSAWMEAAQNGMLVKGYKPTMLDLADLASRPATNSLEKGGAQEKTIDPNYSTRQPSASQKDSSQPATVVQDTREDRAHKTEHLDPELSAKAKAFQANKPAFVVKKYPELAAAYGMIAAARVFAADKLPEATRDEFVNMAERHVVERIMDGGQIQGPKIYVAPARGKDVGDNAESIPELPDQGASHRLKVADKER